MRAPSRASGAQLFVVGLVLILLSPLLAFGLQASANATHFLARPGVPAVGPGADTSTYSSSDVDTIVTSATWVGVTSTVVVSFGDFGDPGALALVNGPDPREVAWVQPTCDPIAVAAEGSSPNALVLCEGALGECTTAALVVLNTTSQALGPQIPLPSECFYHFEVLYDQRTSLAYVIEEPQSITDSARLLGVDLSNGEVVSNVSIAPSEYPYGHVMALSPVAGTIFILNPQSSAVSSVNTSTGVSGSSFPVPSNETTVWYDSISNEVFAAWHTPTNTSTAVLDGATLGLVKLLPYDGLFGVVVDSAIGETYFLSGSAITTVQDSDSSVLGNVTFLYGSEQLAYDPNNMNFVGATGEGSLGVQEIGLSRYTVATAGFSAVPILGTGFPFYVAAVALVLGACLTLRFLPQYRKARRLREEESSRKFRAWLDEGRSSKWQGQDPPPSGK